MPVLDQIERVESETAERVETVQDRILKLNKSVAERLTPRLENLPELPFTERLPQPKDVAETYFDMITRIAERNRAFTVSMIDTWSAPAKPAKKAKATAKKATK